MKRKLLKFVIDFKKSSPVLFYLTILSFILAMLPFLHCVITYFPENKFLRSWMFLIPFLVVFLISFISYISYEKISFIKNPVINILRKLITISLNLCIIFLVQIFCGLFLWGFFDICNDNDKFDKPEYYEEVLSMFTNEKRVAHFPKTIPNNTKNVEMGGSAPFFRSDGELFLKFDIDRKYIEDELKKYKFISIENYNKFSERYWPYPYEDGKTFKVQDFTYYVINDNENENLHEHAYIFHCGIGVNKDKTQIMYYYADPD